jgi:hypothetical protein
VKPLTAQGGLYFRFGGKWIGLKALRMHVSRMLTHTLSDVIMYIQG